jgi:hypothetical protein
MIGTVQEIGQSKGGKPKAKIAGKWYFLPTDRDTGHGDSPAVNQSIEFEEGIPFGDNGQFLTISKWRPAGQQARPQPAQQQRPAPQAAKPAEYIDEASLRFISNVVGSAIAAKTITTPGQVSAWFNAAKAALEGKGAEIPFSDDVPPMTDDNYEPTNTGRSNW